MRFFFQSDAAVAALEREALRWQGTPFFHGACSAGAGCDCVRHAHALLSASGAVPSHFEFPPYAIDGGHHGDHTLLLTLLTSPALAGRFALTPPAAPRLPGDLYGLRSGAAVHHLAIHLPGGRVTHSLERRGVIIHAADDDAFQRRVLFILRPMEIRN